MAKDGLVQLEIDLKKIEKMFSTEGFGGRFDMGTFGNHKPGEHKPEEQNFCGTAACMAGWLGIVNPAMKAKWNRQGNLVTGFSSCHNDDQWETAASAVYGISKEDAMKIFYSNTNISGPEALARKTEEMRMAIKREKLRRKIKELRPKIEQNQKTAYAQARALEKKAAKLQIEADKLRTKADEEGDKIDAIQSQIDELEI